MRKKQTKERIKVFAIGTIEREFLKDELISMQSILKGKYFSGNREGIFSRHLYFQLDINKNRHRIFIFTYEIKFRL